MTRVFVCIEHRTRFLETHGCPESVCVLPPVEWSSLDDQQRADFMALTGVRTTREAMRTLLRVVR